MNFGEVLGKPFKMIWKNPLLWAVAMIGNIIPTVLTFFVAIWFLSNPELLRIYSATSMVDRQALLNSLEQTFAGIGWQQVLSTFLAVFIGLVVVGLVSAIVTEYIKCCIVRGAAVVDDGTEKPGFTRILKEGWKPFGKLLVQDILFRVAFSLVMGVIIALVVGIGVAASGNNNGSVWGIVVLILCSLCIIVPVAYFIFVLLRTVRVSLIHDNSGIFSSIGKGWQAFKKGFGWLLLLGVILIIGSIAVTWVINTIVSSISSMVSLSSVAANEPLLTTGRVVILGISGLVSFFISSYILVYSFTAWTLAYRRSQSSAGCARSAAPSRPRGGYLAPGDTFVANQKSPCKWGLGFWK